MLHGGAMCEGPTEDERPCELVPCPFDCEWNAWMDWAPCDESCSPELQERSRVIEVFAQYGGVPFPEPPGFFEEQECNNGECPIDCKVSP